MNLVLLGVAAYVAVQLLIGMLVSTRIRTEADYLLAGRSLGYVLATSSIFATWFGAESCLGAAGQVYENGLVGASTDPFGYALCILLMGLVLAVPLWHRGLTTIADLFHLRYSRAVERLAALIMIPTSVLWAAAQIRAFGHVLAASSPDLDPRLGISIAAAVVVLYTWRGGLWADAVTDVVQGVALILGLVVLLYALHGREGGIFGAISAVEPERLAILPRRAGGSVDWWLTAETWARPVLGSVVAQELIARVLASRSPTVARRSTLAASGLYLAVGLIPVLVGLAAVSELPGLEHPEQVLPAFAQRHLGTGLYILFAGALISAILSTVDSALLVSGSLLSRNLILAGPENADDARRLKLARAGVVLFGGIAWALALSAESVHSLVQEASAFGSAGIVVILGFGLFSRHGGPRSALAALVAGVAAWVLGEHLLGFDYAFLGSLAASLAAYLAFARFERAAPLLATAGPAVEPRPG